jgi:putative transposase
MAFAVRRCREPYNAALEERRDAWQKCRVSVSVAAQSGQLPDMKEARPEYGDIHSQVLQDALTRLDSAFQAFFRRVKNGAEPGYPCFQGSNRYNSFTDKQVGNGPRWRTASSSCRRSGAARCAGHVRSRAYRRPSRSAVRRMAGMSASPAPMC